MSLLRKGCLFLLIVMVALLIVSTIGLFVADGRYEFLRDAPRTQHEDILNLDPSIRLLIDPEKLVTVARGIVEEQLQREVPDWLLSRIVPYQISTIMNANHDDGTIRVRLFINERRLGPLIAKQFNATSILEGFPEFEWDPEGLVPYQRGALTLKGTVPMDMQAQEDAWYTWTQGTSLQPLPPDGTHLFEVLGDNREGAAYVVAASLMKAYDYNLDEREQDVSFTSFQFVRSMHLTGDVVGTNALKMRLSMDVINEFKDRIAVVNLVAFLTRLLTTLGDNFEEYHDIEFSGDRHWEDNVVIFEYTLNDLSQTLGLLARGELFVR